MSKSRDGYRVVGTATTGGLHCWYFPTLKDANTFAQHLCRSNGEEVDVMKYVGSWKLSEAPIEFVSASDDIEHRS